MCIYTYVHRFICMHVIRRIRHARYVNTWYCTHPRGWDMLQMWIHRVTYMNHVIYMNEPRHIYGRVCNIDDHADETCCMCEYLILHTSTWMRHLVSHIWIMSYIWMRRVIYMNEMCHTYDWDMPHIWMGHVIYRRRVHAMSRCTSAWMGHAKGWLRLVGSLKL